MICLLVTLVLGVAFAFLIVAVVAAGTQPPQQQQQQNVYLFVSEGVKIHEDR